MAEEQKGLSIEEVRQRDQKRIDDLFKMFTNILTPIVESKPFRDNLGMKKTVMRQDCRALMMLYVNIQLLEEVKKLNQLMSSNGNVKEEVREKLKKKGR